MPPQPQASHSEFFNMRLGDWGKIAWGWWAEGKGESVGQLKIRRLYFYCCCRRFYILLIRQIMKNPLGKCAHPEKSCWKSKRPRDRALCVQRILSPSPSQFQTQSQCHRQSTRRMLNSLFPAEAQASRLFLGMAFP